MTERVIVLGARGRFGRAAAGAFREGGWQVTALARSWPADAGMPADVATVAADATDAEELTRAAWGHDVIVNALNPPYDRWATELPRITASVIAAARASDATVMIPGNVYNFGEGMPALLTEDTPHRPTTRKGRLREELERAYEAAAAEGVGTVVLRAGDFLERERTGNWFDSHITARVGEGRLMYPGPRDRVHAWAYLPDVARAMVGLAATREAFAPFEAFGFPGYALTGDELVATVEHLTGRTMKVSGMPWSLMRVLGLVTPMMREIVEMAYLWRVPHAIDGAKLGAALPGFAVTQPNIAFADCLRLETPGSGRTPRLAMARVA